MLIAPAWLDEFFSIIQSAWSNSVTAEELSECHKKLFEWQVIKEHLKTSNKQFRQFQGGAFQWTSIENTMVQNILS